ncbi:MAG TPA: RNA polymerase sigma factor [Gaiellaceae bacterium]
MAKAAQAATAAAVTEEATASSPNHVDPDGRPDHGAAAARTEELYRDHGRLVGGLCRALLRDRAEAEDATQQVFLAAHRSLLNGTSPREPAAWLATIARNECWARGRARMREPLPSADVDGARSLSDPLADAIRNADLAAMWHAIAALPRQQRDALLLREFGGLSYEELAGALAVSGSAVESLLFRARQGVRTRLQTAYAGVTGGAWLESLARLGGVFGGGMAPVAAKVAAVGVGAAVATGGAVVVPTMLEQGQRTHPVRHGTVVPHRTATPPAQATPPPAVFVARTQGPAAPSGPGERPRRGSSAEDGSSSSTDGHGRTGTTEDTSASGDVQNAVESGTNGSKHEDASRQESGGADSASGTHGPSSDGQSSSSGESGSSGGDGSSGGNGSDGHSGSDNGGVLQTTSNPVVTVILPSADQPPAPVAPSPGDGG